MHEMSIMEGILELAEGELRKHGYRKITRIKLRIGEFRGVVREALEFAFDALKNGTAAEGAVLEIESVAIRLECATCGAVDYRDGDLNLLCPGCGSPVDFVAGREMQVEYLDME